MSMTLVTRPEQVKTEWIQRNLTTLLKIAKYEMISVYLFDNLEEAKAYERSCLDAKLPVTSLNGFNPLEIVVTACVEMKNDPRAR